MTKHHDAEQRELLRAIEEHLAATRSRSSRPPQTNEYVSEFPQDGRLPQFEARQPLGSGIIPPSEVLARDVPRRKSPYFVTASVVGALALFTAGLLLVNGRSDRQPAAAPVTTEPVKLADTTEQTGRHPPREPVWVSLSATPLDAEINLDGRRVSNPYRAAHGRDTASHHVSVTLSGYRTLEREVSFAHELELQFALDTTSRSGTPRRTGPSATVRQVAGNPPVANPAPATSPAPATLPAEESNPGATKPGDDLREFDVRASKARDIDETDPYKR